MAELAAATAMLTTAEAAAVAKVAEKNSGASSLCPDSPPRASFIAQKQWDARNLELINADDERALLLEEFPTLRLLKLDPNVAHIQTKLLDTNTEISEHVFFTHRLVRLVVELGLEQLPTTASQVVAPSNTSFDGLSWGEPVFAVSIMRAGDPLEQGLRDVCKAIRVAHVLIQNETMTESKVKRVNTFYSTISCVDAVEARWCLLLDCSINSGETLLEAIKLVQESGVSAKKIIVVSLFATKQGLNTIKAAFPSVTIVTSGVPKANPVPIVFSASYFGV